MAASVEVKVGHKTYPSKSDAIRALALEGKTCSEIAKLVNANYVHAYQVMKKMNEKPVLVTVDGEAEAPVAKAAKKDDSVFFGVETISIPKKTTTKKISLTVDKTTPGKTVVTKVEKVVPSTTKKKTLADVGNISKKHSGFYGSTHGNTVQWDGKKGIDLDTNEEVHVSAILFDMPIEIAD